MLKHEKEVQWPLVGHTPRRRGVGRDRDDEQRNRFNGLSSAPSAASAPRLRAPPRPRADREHTQHHEPLSQWPLVRHPSRRPRRAMSRTKWHTWRPFQWPLVGHTSRRPLLWIKKYRDGLKAF